MDSAKLRQHAALCLHLADMISDNKSKAELRKMAADYRRLAEKADQAEPLTKIFIGREPD
jgi:hypothetical protein